ncbi:hypothetical protein Z517_04603 [Fonsecaea pedrosoi CBS 271.37]|uniref:YTH domain-containing protein n=1 Tax=Fonsecaea pedrosoi CBS 271.37 TaxID=1442368 RepID=A0A0D2F4L2_9EURO|nr:uncharacterized protein Z517_04603 [Fonsecaea pedrosoi CBS 271.37]KIW81577.1 hypothetical protein Z517_04603 [Fonsecaea pedrosoi CBS 271.37]
MDLCGVCRQGVDDSNPPRSSSTRPSRYQGGLALWVGNIPQNTTVMSLRDYFSEPAPCDLLSVSYNPDARYAFVNFSSEAARLAAIRLAGSRLFDGRRLDCRIRHEFRGRSTKVNYGLNTSTNKALLTSSSPVRCDRAKSLRSKVEEFTHFPEADRSSWGKEKYFILKSFSLDALYQSLETGRWHVPKRHVERLNHAYQTASKVYLIFSVNGSGCFFGYAVMRSEIRVEDDDLIPFGDEVHVISPHGFEVEDDSGASQPEFECDAQPTAVRSRTESLASSDSTMTCSSTASWSSLSPSSSVSSGSIIYQPERRRIIWEASWPPRTTPRETVSTEEDLHTNSPTGSLSVSEIHPQPQPLPWPVGRTDPHSLSTLTATATTLSNRTESPDDMASRFTATANGDSDASSSSSFLATLDRFSSPCRIKWLCAQSLPFAAVRGLTNPWNADKEVHVARNVTPVEPTVAARLLESWGTATAASRSTFGSGSRLGSGAGSGSTSEVGVTSRG